MTNPTRLSAALLTLACAELFTAPASATFYVVESRPGASQTMIPTFISQAPFGYQDYGLGIENTTRFSGPSAGSLWFDDYVSTNYVVNYSFKVIDDEVFPDYSDVFIEMDLGTYAGLTATSTTPIPGGIAEESFVVRNNNSLLLGQGDTITQAVSLTFTQPGPFYTLNSLYRYISASWQGVRQSSDNGIYLPKVESHAAVYTFSGDSTSDLSKAVDWLPNLYDSLPSTPAGAINAIYRAIRGNDSQHNTPANRQIILPTPGSNGIRGSVDADGTALHTASPGILSYDLQLPDKNTLSVPVVFDANYQDATIDIYFDNVLLGSFSGSGQESGVLSYLDLDITTVRNTLGEFRIELNTTGPDSASVFFPESLRVLTQLPGDTDGDGDVDDSDLGNAFANYTGPVGASGGKSVLEGDTDGDGDVDDSDLGSAFAAYTGPFAPRSVPEPTSALMLTAVIGFIGRRRRNAAR